MTGKERVKSILHREPVDRIAVFEHFWGETYGKWQTPGENGACIPEGTDFNQYFDFDMIENWAFDFVADMSFNREILEETEDTVLYKDGNGASLRYHKKHSSTPEHVDFSVVDGESWQPYREKLLGTPVKDRIHFDNIREIKRQAEEHQKYGMLATMNVFECLHPIMGHENMLANMILEPETMHDMITVYSDLICELISTAFDEVGPTDGVFIYEDMGFKEHPFVSPAMFEEFFLPAHSKIMSCIKSYGCEIIEHSCGFIEPLIPGMIKSGIDCLEAMEVKAGMDLLRIKENHGDKIVLMGGLDVRELESNDFARIDAELQKKVPTAMKDSGFILHTDHSVPPTVELESYEYFVKRGLELGTY